MNLVLALAGALLLSLICEKAEAQVAREAFYSIPSETVSAADFLMGKKGTPVSLAGQLRLAKSGSPKQPLVILLHSASGPITDGAPYEEWPRVLNEIGIATFAVDSYAGRGLVNYPADPGKISFLTRIIDAYRALEVAAKGSTDRPLADRRDGLLAGRGSRSLFQHGSISENVRQPRPSFRRAHICLRHMHHALSRRRERDDTDPHAARNSGRSYSHSRHAASMRSDFRKRARARVSSNTPTHTTNSTLRCTGQPLSLSKRRTRLDDAVLKKARMAPF